MTDIRYGTTRDPKWYAMVSPTCILVVDSAVTDERARDLWSSVHDATGAQAVLDALTRGGISSTPSFALAVIPQDFGGAPSSISMIVRGALSVSVVSATERVQISGDGVSTWVERALPEATYLEIGSPGPVGSAKSRAAGYILNDGTAPVDWLTAGQAAGTQTVAPAERTDVAVDPGVTITDPTLVSSSAAAEAESGYDFLFGETVVRTIEGATARNEGSVAGDHDGRTAVGLSAVERRAAREARRKPPVVVAEIAPQFALRFSTGELEPLDQTLVIGRAPSASKVSAASVPRLVTVGGPDQDISRNHVQVAVEGGTVLVTDLHSRNGTMLTLPDRAPQQLRGGQPTAVISGAIVDLGSGISFTVGAS